MTPRFSANRTVREYTERYYLPAEERAADRSTRGQQLVSWQRALGEQWPAVHFGKMEVATADGRHAFRVHVYLGKLQPEFVQVELYADTTDTDESGTQATTRQEELVGALRGYVYVAQVPASRPAGDYTPRVVPSHGGAQVPLEARQIQWYR